MSRVGGLVLAMLVLTAPGAWAAPVATPDAPPGLVVHDGRLSARLTRMPWTAVAAMIQQQTGVRVRLLGDASGGAATATFDRLDFESAVRRLFGAAGSVMFVYGGPGGAPSAFPDEVWILAGGRPATLSDPSEGADTDDPETAIARLRDPDPDVRREVAETLAESGDASKLEVLVPVITADEDPDVRAAVAHALARAGTPPALRIFRLALRDPELAVRFRAIDALLDVRGRPAAEILPEMILDDPDEGVRTAASDALEEVRRDPPEDTEGRDP